VNAFWLILAALALGGGGDEPPSEPATPATPTTPTTPTGRGCGRTAFAGLRALEVLTGGAAAGDDVPLHVFLHGRGTASAESVASLVRSISVPSRTLVLEGPVRLPSGGHAWTVARCADADQTTLANQTRWTADVLQRALAEIAACYGRKPVLSGFSNGAMLAYAIGARNLPDVAGVVAFAGCLPLELWAAMRGVVGVHGRTDAVVPFAPTEAMAGATGVDFRPVDGGHDSTAGVAAWRAAVEGLLA